MKSKIYKLKKDVIGKDLKMPKLKSKVINNDGGKIFEKNSKIYNLKNQDRFLIDYSNLKTGLITHQKKFANMKDISLFEKKLKLVSFSFAFNHKSISP